MKNVFTNTRKGILMVAMFTTLLSFANDASSFIIKNDAKRTSLTLEHVKEGNLLSIKDNNGIVLYKERIEQSGLYSKGFDLTALPDGSYMFELDGDVEIKTIPFKVKSNKVLFNKSLELTIFKPIVRVKEDLVLISKLALNKAPLHIDVYFKNNSSGSHIIYSETIKEKKKMGRILKLDALEKGSYKIVMHSENREFIKYINK